MVYKYVFLCIYENIQNKKHCLLANNNKNFLKNKNNQKMSKVKKKKQKEQRKQKKYKICYIKICDVFEYKDNKY